MAISKLLPDGETREGNLWHIILDESGTISAPLTALELEAQERELLQQYQRLLAALKPFFDQIPKLPAEEQPYLRDCHMGRIFPFGTGSEYFNYPEGIHAFLELPRTIAKHCLMAFQNLDSIAWLRLARITNSEVSFYVSQPDISLPLRDNKELTVQLESRRWNNDMTQYVTRCRLQKLYNEIQDFLMLIERLTKQYWEEEWEVQTAVAELEARKGIRNILTRHRARELRNEMRFGPDPPFIATESKARGIVYLGLVDQTFDKKDYELRILDLFDAQFKKLAKFMRKAGGQSTDPPFTTPSGPGVYRDLIQKVTDNGGR